MVYKTYLVGQYEKIKKQSGTCIQRGVGRQKTGEGETEVLAQTWHFALYMQSLNIGPS